MIVIHRSQVLDIQSMLQLLQGVAERAVLGRVTYMMGCVRGNANSECQCDGCWPSVVAEVPGVGRPSGAPDQGRPHNADGKFGRVVAADQDLCHALREEVCIGRPGAFQVLLHLRGSRDSAQRQCSAAVTLSIAQRTLEGRS